MHGKGDDELDVARVCLATPSHLARCTAEGLLHQALQVVLLRRHEGRHGTACAARTACAHEPAGGPRGGQAGARTDDQHREAQAEHLPEGEPLRHAQAHQAAGLLLVAHGELRVELGRHVLHVVRVERGLLGLRQARAALPAALGARNGAGHAWGVVTPSAGDLASAPRQLHRLPRVEAEHLAVSGLLAALLAGEGGLLLGDHVAVHAQWRGVGVVLEAVDVPGHAFGLGTWHLLR
mmetsp:Transcript_95063/g.283856  ORF Transcript_95063/g.283856 Transcript_95063/m.283856 type:complete len:236 (+) Transcript_95063:213-920(+)